MYLQVGVVGTSSYVCYDDTGSPAAQPFSGVYKRVHSVIYYPRVQVLLSMVPLFAPRGVTLKFAPPFPPHTHASCPHTQATGWSLSMRTRSGSAAVARGVGARTIMVTAIIMALAGAAPAIAAETNRRGTLARVLTTLMYSPPPSHHHCYRHCQGRRLECIHRLPPPPTFRGEDTLTTSSSVFQHCRHPPSPPWLTRPSRPLSCYPRRRSRPCGWRTCWM